MPEKLKTVRRDYSSEIIARILSLRNLGNPFAETAENVTLLRSAVAHIIHRAARKPEEHYRPSKRAGRPLERDPNDNLAALGCGFYRRMRQPLRRGQTHVHATILDAQVPHWNINI